MKQNSEQIVNSPQWGGVTDPSQHDPEQFRYLVHAINPFSAMNALTITASDSVNGVTYDESWGDQKISMYNQPERLAERVSMSMSLVDQDHTATWGEAGLIVEAPENNVILTSASDAGAHNNNLNVLLKQGDKHGTVSGDELLRRSSPHSYNEVVAIANRDGQHAQLKGFFYKATKAGEPYDKQLANQMQMHASRLGLPVVAITQEGPYTKDKVESLNDKLAVHFNGSRYLLSGFDAPMQFKVYDERMNGKFMAPHEIEPVLSYAIASGGLTEADAVNIAKAYEEADKQRQTPRVEFEDDGTVKEISYKKFYGADEIKLSLGKTGHGYRTNLARQSEEAKKSMFAMGSNQIMSFGEDRSFNALSPYEGDEMVKIACASLDDEKAAVVQVWYGEHRKVLEKQWEHHMHASQRLFGSLGSAVLRDIAPKSNFDPQDTKIFKIT